MTSQSETCVLRRILLVEDSPTQALEVKQILEDHGYVVEAVHDGREGLNRALGGVFSLILLDYDLPGMNGLGILEKIRERAVRAPVVMITGSPDVRVAVETLKRGASDYVIKDAYYAVTLPATIARVVEKARLQEQLEAAQAELARHARSLEEIVAERTRQLKDSYHSTLDSLVAALDAREHETQNHSQRVAIRTVHLARRLGVEERVLPVIAQGSLMHDVGKIGVPDAILLKPGPLTAEEWVAMKKHPEIGFNILEGIDFLREAREIVFAHQERYDGSGYPRGLRGDNIPLGARIFAAVDAFDAITNDRPYRKGRPYDAARKEIVGGAGTQFDPEVVRVFLDIPEQEWRGLSGTIHGPGKGQFRP